jgi:hypothetical protein
MPNSLRTFQCRIADHSPALDAMGALFGTLERRLYAAIATGAADMKLLKRQFIADGITARHFNSLRISVEATIKGAREAMKLQVDDVEARIKAIDRKLAALAKEPSPTARLRNEIHQRKRRRAILLHRITRLRARIAAPAPGICYGSRRLFNAQHHLALNGYADHAAWRTDWQARRSNHILFVGAACETAGNLNAQGRIEAGGSIAVKLRVPDALIRQFGRYVELRGLRFTYGTVAITAALAAGVAGTKQTPVTWRFVRDAQGWRAFVTVHETSGRILVAWRALDPSTVHCSTALNADAVAHVAGLLDLKLDDGLLAAIDSVQQQLALDSASYRHCCSSAPFAAAETARLVCRRRPDAEVLALWLADAVLAIRLKWPAPLPLVAGAVLHPSLRRLSSVSHTGVADDEEDGLYHRRPRRHLRRPYPGDPDWMRSCTLAYAHSAIHACDLFAELERKTQKLTAVSPRLRAKGADAVIEHLHNEDAAFPSTRVPGAGTMSKRGMQRLFDRLIALGAVRELTGRTTSRLYGL